MRTFLYNIVARLVIVVTAVRGAHRQCGVGGRTEDELETSASALKYFVPSLPKRLVAARFQNIPLLFSSSRTSCWPTYGQQVSATLELFVRSIFHTKRSSGVPTTTCSQSMLHYSTNLEPQIVGQNFDFRWPIVGMNKLMNTNRWGSRLSHCPTTRSMTMGDDKLSEAWEG